MHPQSLGSNIYGCEEIVASKRKGLLVTHGAPAPPMIWSFERRIAIELDSSTHLSIFVFQTEAIAVSDAVSFAIELVYAT